MIAGADVSAVFPGRSRPLRSAFVVGAPRCGTTFLAKLMARHPQICFSRPKESYFFVREPAAARPDAMREFLRRHFHALEDSHDLIAEGSPSTLYDPAVALRILELDPDARFVLSVRNPVELAPSFHARLLYTTDEEVRDFATAWSLQEARARGESIPRRCREPRMLQYREVCSLAAPVDGFLRSVGRERCHVVVFDDLAADPRKVYVSLLEFLGLDDDGRTAFARKRENRDVARPWLQSWLINPPRPVAAWLVRRERRALALPPWLRRLRRRIKRANTRKTARAPLSRELRETLRATFAADVDRLGQVIGRDLSHWR
jgi:hypothetical protein